MKHMEEVLIPESKKNVIKKVTCDFCGNELSESSRNVDEVEIKHEKGFRCYDSGNITETSFDMCGDCFTDKFIPWAESFGVKPRIEEIDY